MRVVVVDPYQQRVTRSSPRVLRRFCQRTIGLEFSLEWWAVCPVSGDDDAPDSAGVSAVCEQGGASRWGQRFFRLKNVPLTFPGICVFAGALPPGPTDVPAWFANEIESRVIWCPPETCLLRFERMQRIAVEPGGKRRTLHATIPVFGHKSRGGSTDSLVSDQN